MTHVVLTLRLKGWCLKLGGWSIMVFFNDFREHLSDCPLLDKVGFYFLSEDDKITLSTLFASFEIYQTCFLWNLSDFICSTCFLWNLSDLFSLKSIRLYLPCLLPLKSITLVYFEIHQTVVFCNGKVFEIYHTVAFCDEKV